MLPHWIRILPHLLDISGYYNVQAHVPAKSPSISHESCWNLLFCSLCDFCLFSLHPVSQLRVGGWAGGLGGGCTETSTRRVPITEVSSLMHRKLQWRSTERVIRLRPGEVLNFTRQTQFSNKMTARDINECQWGESRGLTTLTAGFI